MSNPNQIILIDTDKLLFDPENPRLPRSLNKNDDKEVIKWMIDHEHLTELMLSLAEKGFFPAEPLLVTAKQNTDKYVVVEGNRRLTAIKILLHPDLAESRKTTIAEIVSEAKEINSLKQIPCLVFPSADDIQLYLGYRHITGVQPWDALAKARFLKKLSSSIQGSNKLEKYRTLAKIIGSRADYVKQLLIGLDVYEKIESNSFYNIPNLNEKSMQFGVLYTALNHSDISDFIGVKEEEENPLSNLNEANLKELTEWMFKEYSEGTRLGESRNLKYLGKVLKNARSLAAFRDGKPLMEAVLLTNEPNEIFENSISDSLNKINTAKDIMHRVEEITPTTPKDIKDIRSIAKILDDFCKSKMKEEEEEDL